MIEVQGYDVNRTISEPNNHGFNFNTKIRGTFGAINPEHTVFNVGIMKNASTYFLDQASKQNWTYQFIPFDKKIECFVILRDPFERYISALVEDILRYNSINPNNENFIDYLIENRKLFDFFNFLFDNKIFKIYDHTVSQRDQIKSLMEDFGIHNITFIKLTENLADNINAFLSSRQCQSVFSKEELHSRKDKPLYSLINEYFFDGKNLTRKENLFEYLKSDYDFINSVNFFNRY